MQRNCKQSVHGGEYAYANSFMCNFAAMYLMNDIFVHGCSYKQCCAKYKPKYCKTVTTFGEYACIRSLVNCAIRISYLGIISNVVLN